MTFSFVSHEEFPDDPYIKELVYLCLEDKIRVAYIRKDTKNGGKFWAKMGAFIMKEGVKQAYDSFIQDSTFLDKDIKSFLDGRKWETKSVSKPREDLMPF